MANPTLTPDNKEDADARYDPTRLKNAEENAYADSGIDQAEAFANDPENAVKDAEENPMNYDAGSSRPAANTSSRGGLIGKALNYKKGGPIGLIIALLFGGGVGITSLVSPALLLVHMKETFLSKFNTQLTAMDARTTKILGGKINDTTKGGCGKISVIKCKYASMSERQMKKFKAAGIEVVGEDTTVTGRTKPTSFKFNGKEIKPKDFVKTLNSDPQFRAAVKTAYNPKLAGFSDQIFKKLATRFKISKASSGLEDKTDDKERAKSLQESTKEGSADLDKAGAPECESGKECKNQNKGGGDVDEADSGKVNDVVDGIAQEASESGDVTKASEALSAAKIGGETFGSLFKITGALDNACTVYGTVRAVGFAAKTVRYAQLIRFGMVMSTVADKIKAGTAQPEEVSYVGNLATNTLLNSDGSHSPSATDSAGFKLAAYSEYNTTKSDNASKFLVAGGLAGSLSSVTSVINKTLGGTPRSTCGFLANPFVQVGSLAVGIAFMFVPVVGQAGTATKLAVQAGLGVAFGVAMALLPAILADTLAGNVIDLNPTPEDVGDAWSSGSGALASSLSNAGGGAPLTVDQAVAYEQDTKQTELAYAAEDRATLSPLDATNSNTFVGSIVNSMLPVMSSTASLTSLTSSALSLTGRSFASIVSPNSGAADSADYYKQCKDEDYNDLKGDGSNVAVAADANCNIIFGIPQKYLDLDPQDVIDKISDDIDQDSGAPVSQDYKDFIQHCVDRQNGGDQMPFGYAGDDQTFSDGSECILNDENLAAHPKYPYFYVHLIDQRVRGAMDEEDQETDDVIEEGETGNSGDANIGGTKQELAKAIIDSNKVTYLNGVNSTSGARGKIIADIASGKTDGNSTSCGMHIKSLQLIKFLADHHTSVQIGDTNSLCTGAYQGRRLSSRHIGGNGSAVDISAVDGIPVNGGNAKSLEVLREIKPLLSQGSGYNNRSQVGQIQCRGYIDLGKVSQFPDACSHIHVDFPASADPDLKETNGAS